MASNPLFGFHINHYDCRYERLTRCAMTLDSFFCQGALAQMEYSPTIPANSVQR